jgi:CPA1 family monovalent cation:H+ antiporter
VHEEVVLVVAGVVAGGVVAQWIAWRLRLPAILFLLVGGLVAGPATGALDPDHTFGAQLFPFVSIAVAVVLFEGSMSLGWRTLRSGGATLWRLLTLGAVVALVGIALSARWVLGVPWELAALLACVLVVTGPTVIGPIVESLGPTGRVGTILEAEGTLIDPLGAVLTVLVFQAAFGPSGSVASVALGITLTLAVGGVVGLVAAVGVVVLLSRYLLPDRLHNVTTLALVVGAYAGSNLLRAESGLVAVTSMGVALATQRRVEVRHVLEFNETLRILFISGLFVVLAARIDRSTLAAIEWRNLAFLGLLVVLVRPLSVLLSTVRTDLPAAERIFLAATAPRGIVAASVASVFSLRLVDHGVPGAQILLSATLTVILGTVLLSGFASRPLATRLGLVGAEDDVIIVLGANPVAREFADALVRHGADVSIVDLDRRELSAARMSGFATHHGSVIADGTWQRAGVARATSFVAMTASDELNTLASRQAGAVLGRKKVFQLAPGRPEHESWWSLPAGVVARPLFSRSASFDELARRLEEGWKVTGTKLTATFGPDDYDRQHPGAVQLFAVDPRGAIRIRATDGSTRLREGDTVVALTPPPD